MYKYFELFSIVNRSVPFFFKMKSIESISGRFYGFLCFSIMSICFRQYQLLSYYDPEFAEMLKSLQR